MKQIPIRNSESVALVDDEDFTRCICRGWYLNTDGYVRATAKGHIPLHTFVVGRKWLDHRNRNKLDCQKKNLRPATRKQNNQNRGFNTRNKTGFKGVYKSCGNRRGWCASINPNQKPTHLGTFDSPEEAARAYDAAARKHYGEYARLNFPNGNS